MKLRKLRKTLKAIGLEFWLPLPIISGLFWVTTGWATQTILYSRANITNPVQVDTLPEIDISLKAKLIVIEVKIFKKRGFSTVDVYVSDSRLQEIILDFPTTDIAELETEISSTLSIPREKVQALAQYQINE
ncbi:MULTISPECIES: hypothetical protein [Okeania]|uniref:Uncharacterized protein n=1 Tax=Okeania hirsuta TaxID=1458930 RepID=A0A3N6NWU5_9CYAN|nr:MULTISPECIES: hypothetical protein [Okeania]NET11941.1 hypothetical protein [Okeania sp. SIO1H6]NES76210.1 hypothetical protein [Okeania sp. SIO1H4]NES89189.1 hypothetical protein [Okeania sp. SIO2B9]NET19652.1 hypothetical protein [Okeania sp. SIO1H5]NET74670.1 hypothetical protein [Okeania sp. SIO1F9]